MDVAEIESEMDEAETCLDNAYGNKTDLDDEDSFSWDQYVIDDDEDDDNESENN